MVKRIAAFITLFLFLAFPCATWAVQELDSDANSLIDDGSGGTTSLYNAYTEMNARGTIGTGAANVARGNHTHSYLGGTLSATSGAVVCTTGTGQATGAACGNTGTAGVVKWDANGIPSTAGAGTDYVATETDPVVLAINGIVKSNTSTIAAATRADYAAAQIIGTNTTAESTNPYSLDAANAYGVIINYGATGTINLPAGAAGMNLIIRNSGAFTITINPQDDAIIVRDGTAQSAGVSISLSSGAGNYVALYHDGTAWLTLGFKGTLAQGS